LPIFEEQFTVVGAIKAARDEFPQTLPVETGTVDERDGGIGHCNVPA
jgi:hypothetical protein